MKKVLAIFTATLLAASVYAYDPNVNEKVLKSFNETFSSARDVKWAAFDTYYLVSFEMEGIRSKITYDKEGNMLGAIRYYDPKLLPLNIYNNLKKSYARQELFGVTEVTANNNVVYFVKMQDKRHWYTVKVNGDGNFEVTEKYEKG